MNDFGNFKIGEYTVSGRCYDALKANGYEDEEAVAKLDTNGDKKLSHNELRKLDFHKNQQHQENELTEFDGDGMDDDVPHFHKMNGRHDGPPPPGEEHGGPHEMNGDFDGPPPPPPDGKHGGPHGMNGDFDGPPPPPPGEDGPDGPPPGDGRRPDKKPDSKPGGDKTPAKFMDED